MKTKTTRDFLNDVAAEDSSFSPEDNLLRLVEADRTVGALSSVLNFIITDAFSLTAEESIWISRLLNNALEPLKEIIPSATLGAVRQEMTNSAYSIRMFERSMQPEFAVGATNSTQSFAKDVKYASASEWTEGICQIVLASYPNVRPAISSRIIGSVHGIFTELGVGEDPKQSRSSAYLPNSIRFILRADED
jgi:hypothetical protein